MPLLETFAKLSIKYDMPHLLENNVSVNTIKSIFEEIISGIPQVSIEGPILFNIFFSDFF